MHSTPATSAAPESALIAAQRRQIQRLRWALALLVPASLTALTAAGMEKSRADRNQSDLTTIVHNLKTQTPDLFQSWTSNAVAATYYPATVVAEDGTETPLVGKAIRVNLGDKKLIEIRMNKHPRGFLYMWAPAKSDDDYFNRVVLNPSCANAYALNLEEVNLRKGDAATTSAGKSATHNTDLFDTVTYAPPR